MNVRSRKNKNLRLTIKKTFLGHPIQTAHGPLYLDYLEKMHATIERALDDYPRLMAIRVDLRFPKLRANEECGNVITDFIRSLQSQIAYSGKRKKRQEGGRVHPCKVRNVWVRERSTSMNDHYHLLLMFNKDRFNWLGQTQTPNDNLGSFIVEAWARVVGVDYEEANGLVHFSKKNSDSVVIHRLNRNSDDFDDAFDELFKHISYLAKEDTKHFGSGRRNFGHSHK